MSVSIRHVGLVTGCLFFALSLCVLPYAGIQSDEALFSVPLYHYAGNHLHPAFPGQLMLLGYIGSLKTLLYWPILRFFHPSVWTLRLPVLLAGAGSIFIFLHLTAASGRRIAAVLAAFLLATDPVFLLTNTFDWGPVAIEHLLLVTGCWFLFLFGSQPTSRLSIRHLGIGFFCLGLALWNKAVFVWALSGLTAGGLLVFWPELRALGTRRNLVIALGTFLLGASPLVVYNLRHGDATLNGTARLDPFSLPSKWVQLEGVLNGNSLFGFMVSEESSPQPKPSASFPVWIREHLGEHRRTGFYYVIGALLLTVPWWWRSRAARFSLVFMTVAWIAMASTRDAGTSAHHVILLWPFPILFVASALAELPWRPVAILVGAGLVVMNLLVVNQYISQFERNGPAGGFTDAIFPLSSSLPEQSGQTIYVLDWGISEPLNFLHQGRLDLPATDPSVAPDASRVHTMLTDPQSLFVNHLSGQEFFPALGRALEADAQASGYHKQPLQTVPDSNGRPVFEVYRYAPN